MIPQHVDVGNVVQVDIGVQGPGLGKLLGGHGVGGEHDLRAVEAAGLGQGQLRGAGAVHAAALLAQNAQNGGVGQSLYGKIFLEVRAPGKGLVQRPGRAADAPLVIEVKGGRDRPARPAQIRYREGKSSASLARSNRIMSGHFRHGSLYHIIGVGASTSFVLYT